MKREKITGETQPWVFTTALYFLPLYNSTVCMVVKPNLELYVNFEYGSNPRSEHCLLDWDFKKRIC
jgi:hypothetical protein